MAGMTALKKSWENGGSRAIMSREILFRGKRLSDGNWAEGSFVQLEDAGIPNESYRAVIIPKRESGLFLDLKNDRHELGFRCWDLVDPKTVCQYTGLTDKNGRKIFEGDIVRIDGDVFTVFWDEVNLEIGLKNKEESFGICCVHPNSIEIIGNVFDNPCLILSY